MIAVINERAMIVAREAIIGVPLVAISWGNWVIKIAKARAEMIKAAADKIRTEFIKHLDGGVQPESWQGGQTLDIY